MRTRDSKCRDGTAAEASRGNRNSRCTRDSRCRDGMEAEAAEATDAQMVRQQMQLHVMLAETADAQMVPQQRQQMMGRIFCEMAVLPANTN